MIAGNEMLDGLRAVIAARKARISSKCAFDGEQPPLAAAGTVNDQKGANQ